MIHRELPVVNAVSYLIVIIVGTLDEDENLLLEESKEAGPQGVLDTASWKKHCKESRLSVTAKWKEEKAQQGEQDYYSIPQWP